MAQDLVDKVKEILEYIKAIKYPLDMVIPIKFDLPNGITTMANLNSTYEFHYRTMVSSKTKLSSHSLGHAIDFNPFNNHYISIEGNVKPIGAKYNTNDARTLTKNHPLVIKLKQLGWKWGGDWQTIKDYMRFEKQK